MSALHRPKGEDTGQNQVASPLPPDSSAEQILRLDEILQSVINANESMKQVIEEDLRHQHEALGEHLDRLGDEVKRLRLELATARTGHVLSQPEPEVRRRTMLQPIEPKHSGEIILSHPIDVLRRRIKRPWHYFPLVVGIGVLTVSLIAILILFLPT